MKEENKKHQLQKTVTRYTPQTSTSAVDKKVKIDPGTRLTG
jgi:hypothetical protein